MSENARKPEEQAENKMKNTATETGEKRAPKKKRRKRNRIPLSLAVLLMVITLLFGVVVGYAIGRSAGSSRLSAAEDRIDELTDATEEAGRQEIDIFTEDLSEANRQALAALSGLDTRTGTEHNAFLIDEGFSGISETAETAPEVVAEFSGGVLMSDEVSRAYNERLTAYVFSGYTEQEVAEGLLNDVMEELAAEHVLLAQAQARGLTELTAADQQQIAASAQQQYDEKIDQYTSFVFTEGMSPQDAEDATAAFLLEAEGVSLESIRADIEESWWQQKLRSEIVKAVQVDQAQLLKAYNEQLSEQRERFTASADAYEEARIQGETILHNLSGYRAVRPLILRGSDAAATAQEVLARLDAGESFDSLLALYGEDEGMQESEELYSGGYYISAASTRWDEALVSAAMALKTPGQISGVIALEDGLCILEYVGEVPAGNVDMAKVYDSLTAEALEAAQDAVYDAQLSAWMQEANVKYYPERMQ